ncbi:MAG: hypothetical protein K0M39_01465 [Rhizobium sp.]|nr:hypothetical protein [Rhizobium sp.]
MSPIVRNSSVVAAIVGVAFFGTSLTAIFMVTGDGHAPSFTYFMLPIIEFPAKLFGVTQSKLFPATFFYAAASFAGAFVIQILIMAARWRGDPDDGERN